jgi:hypothetical protein
MDATVCGADFLFFPVLVNPRLLLLLLLLLLPTPPPECGPALKGPTAKVMGTVDGSAVRMGPGVVRT